MSDYLNVLGKLVVVRSWRIVHRGMAATQERTLGSAKATVFRGLKQAGRVVRSSPVGEEVEEGEGEKRRSIGYPEDHHECRGKSLCEQQG